MRGCSRYSSVSPCSDDCLVCLLRQPAKCRLVYQLTVTAVHMGVDFGNFSSGKASC